MRKKSYAVCQGCGKRVEYTDCHEKYAPPEDARCMVLDGWVTLSRWNGLGTVQEFDFCSFICLKKWVDPKVPRIPRPFLEAFQDD